MNTGRVGYPPTLPGEYTDGKLEWTELSVQQKTVKNTENVQKYIEYQYGMNWSSNSSKICDKHFIIKIETLLHHIIHVCVSLYAQ